LVADKKPSPFPQPLRAKVCKIARDEEEVRELLDALWKEPEKGEEILAVARERNGEIYQFEKMLEQRIPTAAWSKSISA